MKPFQKILVPIDFSSHSARTIQVAADLSRRYEAPVTLLHVVEPELISAPGSSQLYDTAKLPAMIEQTTKQLAATQHELKAAGVMQVDTGYAQGVPFKEIVEFARKGAFDLIVLGTHGRSGLKRVLLGSVAERVVQHAPCPVLTVRMSDASSNPAADDQTFRA